MRRCKPLRRDEASPLPLGWGFTHLNPLPSEGLYNSRRTPTICFPNLLQWRTVVWLSLKAEEIISSEYKQNVNRNQGK